MFYGSFHRTIKALRYGFFGRVGGKGRRRAYDEGYPARCNADSDEGYLGRPADTNDADKGCPSRRDANDGEVYTRAGPEVDSTGGPPEEPCSLMPAAEAVEKCDISCQRYHIWMGHRMRFTVDGGNRVR